MSKLSLGLVSRRPHPRPVPPIPEIILIVHASPGDAILSSNRTKWCWPILMVPPLAENGCPEAREDFDCRNCHWGLSSSSSPSDPRITLLFLLIGRIICLLSLMAFRLLAPLNCRRSFHCSTGKKGGSAVSAFAFLDCSLGEVSVMSSVHVEGLCKSHTFLQPSFFLRGNFTTGLGVNSGTIFC